MKTKLLLAFLLIALPLSAWEPERIVVAQETDFSKVEALLAKGWTVKAQSSAAAKRGYDCYHVFTLSPPTDDVILEVQARRELEWKAKREAFLKSQPSVEKK